MELLDFYEKTKHSSKKTQLIEKKVTNLLKYFILYLINQFHYNA